MFQLARDAIARYDRILIHRHARPDGDALGSQIGLKHIILENFPDKEVYLLGDDAGRYGFMEGFSADDIPDAYYQGALAVILDTGARTLISDGRYALAERTLKIDHHIFCDKYADIEIIDTSFESCCGLVTAFAMEAGFRVPPIAAKALYTGMVSDSGRFRYDSTTAETFERAAFLLRQPFSIGEIYANLYEDDLERMQLRASFLSRIRLTKNRVAYLYNDAALMQTLPLDVFSVSRGMVNVMADIRGVSIWVNFTEADGGVQVEIRSSQHNIQPIAVKYGGGGHAKASGATVKDRAAAMLLLEDLDRLSGDADA